ncbi:MAG: Rpn family recombination-promoting nuclease/putative transposase [Marinilabiliaceae bacterium]|nr:Rpn family recombination-promoting nuclease/putative transposase [Marinilabiliaceae bacterium]
MKERSMVSFDWAMKRVLIQKANYEILEGFLSELLRRKIKIKNITESEFNKTSKKDKFGRADALVIADDGELIIIELQFDSQDDYFQRMLYGVSKSIAEYMNEGDKYSKIRKAYSINIVYFELGEGDDYVFHGFTNFTGLHTHNELKLSAKQQSLYTKEIPGELYPEYYIIKIRGFKDVAVDTLDQWIYYLKNNKIRDEFTAQGLDKARKILDYDNLSEEEKIIYKGDVRQERIRESEMETAYSDGEIKGEAKGEAKGLAEGLAKGLEKGEAIGLEKGEAIGLEKSVIRGYKKGHSIEIIADLTSLSKEKILKILKQNGLI